MNYMEYSDYSTLNSEAGALCVEFMDGNAGVMTGITSEATKCT